MRTISRIVQKTEKLDAAVLLDVQFTPARRKLHRSCDVALFEFVLFEMSLDSRFYKM